MNKVIDKLIGVAFLVGVACVGWLLGGILSPDAYTLMLGCILGIMAGIPAALIAVSASKTIRHEHTHRIVADKPQERTLLPAPAPRPRVTIVQPQRAMLSVANPYKQIEVKK